MVKCYGNGKGVGGCARAKGCFWTAVSGGREGDGSRWVNWTGVGGGSGGSL